ncbi:hypothetical protein PoB_005462000 [Plakobranchus ocellatus]|uniref:Uncharacterized protein n=1 Tax=Plakobranchus ocellatus TaxID=259542 RepID=A0AAV4C8W0_9GAST|nr:hypothetical protein PoB_005462000 [Plakobranchus ocellatus]
MIIGVCEIHPSYFDAQRDSPPATHCTLPQPHRVLGQSWSFTISTAIDPSSFKRNNYYATGPGVVALFLSLPAAAAHTRVYGKRSGQRHIQPLDLSLPPYESHLTTNKAPSSWECALYCFQHHQATVQKNWGTAEETSKTITHGKKCE